VTGSKRAEIEDAVFLLHIKCGLRWQVELEERKLDEIRSTADRSQLANLSSIVPNLQTSQQGGERLLKEYRDRIAAINTQLDDPEQVSLLSEKTKNELTSERAALTQREIQLQQELVKIDEKRRSLMQERDQLQRKVNTEDNPGQELSIAEWPTDAVLPSRVQRRRTARDCAAQSAVRCIAQLPSPGSAGSQRQGRW
jgi:valyl-tRNA synthetase